MVLMWNMIMKLEERELSLIKKIKGGGEEFSLGNQIGSEDKWLKSASIGSSPGQVHMVDGQPFRRARQTCDYLTPPSCDLLVAGMISVAHVTTKVHMDGCGLCCMLRPP